MPETNGQGTEELLPELKDSPLPSAALDSGGKIVWSNKAFRKFLGLSSPDDRGLSFSGLLREEDRALLFPPYAPVDKTAFLASPGEEGSPRRISLWTSPLENGGVLLQLLDMTAQRLQEEELAQTRELYRSTIEDSPVFICALSPSGEVIFSNRRCLEFTGAASAELELGQALLGHLAARDEKLSPSSPGGSFEQRIGPDESPHWIRWTYRGLFSPEGECTLIQAFGEDVTAARKAEAALRASEARYRGIVQDLKALVVRYDPEMRFTFVNDTYCRYYKRSRQELLGTSLLNTIEPELGENLLQRLSRLTPENPVTWSEDMSVLPDGTRAWQEWTDRAIFDNGVLVEYQAEGWDITKLRETTRRLERQQELLEQAQRIARMGNWELVPGTRNFIISEEAARILEMEPGTVLSLKMLLGMMREPTRRKVRQAFERLLREGGNESADLELILSGNRVRYCHIMGESRVAADADRPLLHGIIQDVTEQALVDTRLRHSQKMEAIGRLAGGVAHDFNNLLQIILGYGEVLADQLRPQSHELSLLNRIQDAGIKARDLVKRLLLFSRKDHVEVITIDPSEAIKNLTGMLSRIIGEQIRIAFKAEDGLYRINTEPGQFEQALVNICLNARDAMEPEGEIRIEASNADFKNTTPIFGGALPPGRYCRIRVSDSGSGISRDNLPHIFEPFFTTKGLGKGTGLGLSSVYAIVTRHSGFIDVHSVEGEGTVFSLYFPAANRLSPESNTAPEIPPKTGGAYKVLIAEDDEPVRTLAAITLQQAGYEVFEVENGLEAVETFRNHPDIDLLVFDVVMPHLNGREAFISILEADGNIPVIFCTGYSEDKLRSDLLPKNSDWRILRKPYLREALLAAVEEVMDSLSEETAKE